MGRGTWSIRALRQDISRIFTGNLIRAAASEAESIAKKYKPDFLSGHSLGGFLAEIVCSHLGIPGASFATSGPLRSRRLLGKKYGGVKWKAVVNRKDFLANI